MSKPFKQFKTRADERQLALAVSGGQGQVWLTLLSADDRSFPTEPTEIRVPLTATEARRVAALLLLHAKSIDPTGDIDLIAVAPKGRPS